MDFRRFPPAGRRAASLLVLAVGINTRPYMARLPAVMSGRPWIASGRPAFGRGLVSTLFWVRPRYLLRRPFASPKHLSRSRVGPPCLCKSGQRCRRRPRVAISSSTFRRTPAVCLGPDDLSRIFRTPPPSYPSPARRRRRCINPTCRASRSCRRADIGVPQTDRRRSNSRSRCTDPSSAARRRRPSCRCI